MMNMRQAGLAWLQKNIGKVEGRIHVSKLYSDDESWSGSRVWWFEMKVSALDDSSGEIHLLCQKDGSSNGFHYLRVPVPFLSDKIGELHVRPDNERLSLMLSAEKEDTFSELRGDGKVDFSPFLIE